MSALAMGLLKKGYSISGSDLVKNNETNKLEKLGAIIFNSQIGQNTQFNLGMNLYTKGLEDLHLSWN